MSKTRRVVLGTHKNVWHSLRIAIGIMTLLLIMSSGASAVTPINDCTTISSPGAYALTRNIGNSANSIFCISITSSDVVFDGAGYTINGSDAVSTYGVYVYNQSTILTNVTLQNLIVRRWNVGINYSNAQNGIIVGNNVSDGVYRYGIEIVGISLYSSSGITLSGNNASNSYGSGISLKFSSNNTLSGNNASWNYNSAGIVLVSSSNNTLSGNDVSNNNKYGISLSSSSNNNRIDDNKASNTGISTPGYGISLSSSSNNVLSNNIVNSNQNYGIYLDSNSNNNMLSRNNASNNRINGISLSTSSNNMVSGNNAYSNIDGISLSSSSNNTLSSNNASNNNRGFSLSSYSNNNTLAGNSASNNGLDASGIGIYFDYSSNNTIYNNIFNNTNNVNFYRSSINTWNITRQPGINIIGGSYLGGNVWVYPSGTGYSQTCNDADSDGICDSSRTLDASNVDYLPLVYRPAITPTPTTPSPNPTLPGTWDAAAIPAPAVPYIWNSLNFEGFYNTETLTLLGNYAATRTIPRNGLVYNTGKTPVDFKVFEKENIIVDGDQSYQRVGWQGEKLVAIRGVSNKFTKLVLEMGQNDTKTMTTGETWSLGAGYNLTINAVDARTTPRQVWFTLKKNGTVIDEGIGEYSINSTPAAKSRGVYFKKKTILGESDVLLFTVYISNIFSGATSDMVQFKYLWLIDESSAREIRAADRFGVFEVRTANPNVIMMDNEDTVNLSRNSEATLMEKMKFVIEDSDTLRFYPTIVGEVTPTPTATPISTATPIPTATPTPSPTATSTPTPTPTPTTDYDTNHDGHISKSEAITAVVDFFSGLISKQQAISIVMQYFQG